MSEYINVGAFNLKYSPNLNPVHLTCEDSLKHLLYNLVTLSYIHSSTFLWCLLNTVFSFIGFLNMQKQIMKSPLTIFK